ncbi:MAG: cytochrome c biogenesis protein CcsA [Deltaproteobacteria bacterium]|nr:cytochrome c biogenesis protein CcsA [Deltaproteobacteria bacterium]
MESLLFKTALLLYALSTVGYMVSLLMKRVLAAKVSTWVLCAAFAVHSVYIVFRWVAAGYNPAVNLYEALSFSAWAIAGVYLLSQVKTKTRVLGAFVSPIVLVLAITALPRAAGDLAIPAMLRSTWVSAHVASILIAGALLALACIAGIAYLVQDNLLKKKRGYGFIRLLPPLRDLDRINHVSIVAGFFLLTFGVVAGSVWAGTVWGSRWYWDPKQVCTLISWFLYAVLLHQRLAIGWKGRKAALLSIIAFGILLFAFVGVNIFFVTVHHFA